MNAFLSEILNAIRQRKYIVGSVDSAGNVSFAARPTVHANAQLAAAETQRLALANPGKTFMYVMLAGGARSATVETL